jgi:hypothetical protein
LIKHSDAVMHKNIIESKSTKISSGMKQYV